MSVTKGRRVIAIDTNVLLRYLLQDDNRQSAKANKLIADSKKILITDVVLVETIWTLKGKKYKLSKDDLMLVIGQLFKEPNITFEDGQTVWRALNDYRNALPVGKGAGKREVDFADTLILEKSQFETARKNEPFGGLYTFDVATRQFDKARKP